MMPARLNPANFDLLMIGADAETTLRGLCKHSVRAGWCAVQDQEGGTRGGVATDPSLRISPLCPGYLAISVVGWSMTWHPLELMQLIFLALLAAMMIAGFTTRVRPRSSREWTFVWAVLVFLAWALLGFGWLRSR